MKSVINRILGDDKGGAHSKDYEGGRYYVVPAFLYQHINKTTFYFGAWGPTGVPRSLMYNSVIRPVMNFMEEDIG